MAELAYLITHKKERQNKMVKIEVDDDVSMSIDKLLKVNTLDFLNKYQNILINNILLNYDDKGVKRDIRYLKKLFVVMKKQIKFAEIETIRP